jgi:hypothetical protein
MDGKIKTHYRKSLIIKPFGKKKSRQIFLTKIKEMIPVKLAYLLFMKGAQR